jgi:hypothetical protein
MVADGVLRLFGASFNARAAGAGTLLAVLHLVGVQLAAYGLSTLPSGVDQSHEIACVLPFGAVLAGRVLAERLTRARLLPALAVVACGYLVALGHGLVQPQQPAHDQALAPWLRAHHLTAGFSNYSDAGAIELVSGDTITMTVPFHPDYVAGFVGIRDFRPPSTG